MNATTDINHIRLQSLELRNFKGIRNFTFTPEGDSLDVYGDNETGKTTLADALTWLLFDKDTLDRSPDSFGIKTRGDDGEVLHGLEHEVIGTFTGGLTLRKVYSEKYTRKRGSADTEFTGHTTDYYIDEEPVQKKEYEERISEIMGEQLFKILTIPTYFAESLHWTDRRDILTELAGDIDTEDIIEAGEGLERYPQVLDGKSREAREKILIQRRRDLNKTLDNIPDRIDQETKGLYDEVGDVQGARDAIDKLKAEKEKVEAKRSQVSSGGAVAELKVEKQELEAKKGELRNAHQAKLDEELQEQREKVSVLQDKVDEAESDYRNTKREYDNAMDQKDSAETALRNRRENLASIQQREPKDASEFEPDICPMCERPMEGEDHDHQQYLEEFNAQKATDLKKQKENVQQAEKQLEDRKELLNKVSDRVAKANGRLNQRTEALRKAQEELERRKAEQQGVEFTDDYQQVCAQISEIETKIENHQVEKQEQLRKLNTHIEGLEQEIEQAQQVIHRAKENERTNARIAELEEERRKTQRQLEQVEEDIHLIEEFVRARSAFITERVNDKFEIVEWRLFTEQINGGLTETCEAIKDGVPFGEGLNNAGRIQAGIDIIRTLSGHYGKSAPIFVDNAESIVRLPETDLQIIRLIVSEQHPKLTVEHTHQPAAVTA